MPAFPIRQCHACAQEITREQHFVDTHQTRDGPYFHLTDECWAGDPHLRYPHANAVAPEPASQLTEREADLAPGRPSSGCCPYAPGQSRLTKPNGDRASPRKLPKAGAGTKRPNKR